MTMVAGDDLEGSSPLTRGKQRMLRVWRRRRGLIPAHAGKTPPSGPCRARARAHPRSRGENAPGRASPPGCGGSSPLTRGKLAVKSYGWDGTGLIPAHAGKTGTRGGLRGRRRAHPRSRGENILKRRFNNRAHGSSPLTRGKLEHTHNPIERKGLIPAHAGKTTVRAS